MRVRCTSRSRTIVSLNVTEMASDGYCYFVLTLTESSIDRVKVLRNFCVQDVYVYTVVSSHSRLTCGIGSGQIYAYCAVHGQRQPRGS